MVGFSRSVSLSACFTFACSITTFVTFVFYGNLFCLTFMGLIGIYYLSIVLITILPGCILRVVATFTIGCYLVTTNSNVCYFGATVESWYCYFGVSICVMVTCFSKRSFCDSDCSLYWLYVSIWLAGCCINVSDYAF